MNFLWNVLCIHMQMHVHGRAHTQAFYLFTWWSPSHKYGIRPNHCDITWRLDFLWCEYRCLYHVILTRAAATASCGFQFVNVSILKRKGCDKAMHRRLEQWFLAFLSIAWSKINDKLQILCSLSRNFIIDLIVFPEHASFFPDCHYFCPFPLNF